jgi:hypothetical protein
MVLKNTDAKLSFIAITILTKNNIKPNAKGSYEVGNHMHIIVYYTIVKESLNPIKNLPSKHNS